EGLVVAQAARAHAAQAQRALLLHEQEQGLVRAEALRGRVEGEAQRVLLVAAAEQHAQHRVHGAEQPRVVPCGSARLGHGGGPRTYTKTGAAGAPGPGVTQREGGATWGVSEKP